MGWSLGEEREQLAAFAVWRKYSYHGWFQATIGYKSLFNRAVLSTYCSEKWSSCCILVDSTIGRVRPRAKWAPVLSSKFSQKNHQGFWNLSYESEPEKDANPNYLQGREMWLSCKLIIWVEGWIILLPGDLLKPVKVHLDIWFYYPCQLSC